MATCEWRKACARSGGRHSPWEDGPAAEKQYVNLAGGPSIQQVPEGNPPLVLWRKLLKCMAFDLRHDLAINSGGVPRPLAWSERVPRGGKLVPFVDLDVETWPMCTVDDLNTFLDIFAIAMFQLFPPPKDEAKPRLAVMQANMTEDGKPNVVVSRYWRCACGRGAMESTWSPSQKMDAQLYECYTCKVRWELSADLTWSVFQYYVGTGVGEHGAKSHARGSAESPALHGEWFDGAGPFGPRGYGKELKPVEVCRQKFGCHIMAINGSVDTPFLRRHGFDGFTLGPYVTKETCEVLRDLFISLLKQHKQQFKTRWTCAQVEGFVDLKCGANLRLPHAPKVRRCLTCRGEHPAACARCNPHGKEIVPGKSYEAVRVVSVAQQPQVQAAVLKALRNADTKYYTHLVAATICVPFSAEETKPRNDAVSFPRVRLQGDPRDPRAKILRGRRGQSMSKAERTLEWEKHNFEERCHAEMPFARGAVPQRSTQLRKAQRDLMKRRMGTKFVLFPVTRAAGDSAKEWELRSNRSQKYATSIEAAIRSSRWRTWQGRKVAKCRELRPYSEVVVANITKVELSGGGFDMFFVNIAGPQITRCPHASNNFTLHGLKNGGEVKISHHRSSAAWFLMRRTVGASYIEQHCYSCKEGKSGSTCKKWKIKLPMKDVAEGAHIERLLWGKNVSCPVTTLPVKVARSRMPAKQGMRGSGAGAGRGTGSRAVPHLAFRRQEMSRLNSLFAIAASSVQNSSMSHDVRRPRDVGVVAAAAPHGPPLPPLPPAAACPTKQSRRRGAPSPPLGAARSDTTTSKRRRRVAVRSGGGGSGSLYVDDEAAFDGRRRKHGGDDSDADGGDDARSGTDQNGDLVGFIAESDDHGTGNNNAAFYTQVGRIMDQRQRQRDGCNAALPLSLHGLHGVRQRRAVELHVFPRRRWAAVTRTHCC